MHHTSVIITGIAVLGAISIIAIYYLKNRLTSFKLDLNKIGMKLGLSADKRVDPIQSRVDLSGANFKNNNEFSVSGKTIVDAKKIRVGNRNVFEIGGTGETNGGK